MDNFEESTSPKELTRSFGGKTEGFESKGEQRFEQKHLKAYLRGDKVFKWGYNTDGTPIFYKVNEIWS